MEWPHPCPLCRVECCVTCVVAHPNRLAFAWCITQQKWAGGAYHIAKHNWGVMIEDQLGTFPHMSIARLINFEKFISEIKIKIIFEDSIFSLHWGLFLF
jgi:hypothetical protein